jgi:gliding-associated putative ABC transporter substrate-binding component GldG
MSDNAKRKLSYSAGSLALLAAIVGIIFIVNFFSDRAFTRFDLTKGKQFTLSQSTKDILAKMPDIITIKAYYSSNIPSPINQYTQDVKDLLHEYQAYGKGKVKLEIIDPVGSPELQDEASKLNINAVALPVVGMDQASTIKIYASIYVQYLDKSETLPNVVNIDTLEYDLTSLISRLTSEKSSTLGLFIEDPQRKLRDEFSQLISFLEKEFKVEDVVVAGGKPIDNKTISVLLVLNPMRVSERDLFELDQYIMNGGQAIILSDGAQVFLQPGQFGAPMPFYAMAMNPQYDSLGPMLTSYGVKRNYDLVMDKKHANYPILGPLGRPYPLFPVVDMTKGQAESQITRGLDHLTFTWASSLDVGPLPDSVKAVKLAVTTPESWVQAGNQLMVDPMQEPLPPLPIPGMGPAERTLAALLSGKFKSYFAGKPAPGIEEGDTTHPAPEPAERKDLSPDTNIMVVGCSRFVSAQNPALSEQNLNFIVAAAEWMTGGQRLADIKNRKAETKPITELTGAQFIVIAVIAPFIAPLGIIIFGVSRFTIRRGRRRKFLESVEK